MRSIRIRVRSLLRLHWSLLTVLACTCACSDVPYIAYEIPEGYIGWISVEFGKDGCDDIGAFPLSYRIEISPSGRGCTSAAITKTQLVGYFYVDATGKSVTKLQSSGWGEGGMIWAGYVDGTSELFFVGPEKELKNTDKHPWGKVH